MDCGAEGVKEMTRFEYAVELLKILCNCVSENGLVRMEAVEATARAIMDLGKREGAEGK